MFGIFKKKEFPYCDGSKKPIRKNHERNLYFSVPGAGEIELSKSCNYHTGRVSGFSIGVSWGRFGFAGGVLDREDAKRMAEYILSEYAKITQEEKDKEQQQLKERDERLKELGWDK